MAAFQHLQDFREDASFKTWLLSIAWRKALTRRRNVRTFLRRFVQPPEDTEWQVPDAGRTQEQAVLDDELHGHIRREIARLAPKFRDALLLASAGDHSYNDIAGMLGIPVGTLKWRVNEARRQLKAGSRGWGTAVSDARQDPGFGIRDSGFGDPGIRTALGGQTGRSRRRHRRGCAGDDGVRAVGRPARPRARAHRAGAAPRLARRSALGLGGRGRSRRAGRRDGRLGGEAGAGPR